MFFLKIIFKDYYLKILIPISVTFIAIIAFAYTGFYKNKLIEVYGNRQLTEDVKNSIEITMKNNQNNQMFTKLKHNQKYINDN